MAVRHLLADACFDGEKLLGRGPWRVTVDRGVITALEPAAPDAEADIAGAFLMPGLVEAHAHVGLDGSLTDPGARNAQLQAGMADRLATARANLEKSTRAGITLVRDAGDRFGVNHALRAEVRANPEQPITLRSPGAALKRAKHYGAFIGCDVGKYRSDIIAAVAARCNDGGAAGESAGAATGDQASDDIKIILTGVVDFAAGSVKGEPQFTLDELQLIATEAHARGRKTFAHCSGLAGLDVAVAAGVDSIEHGYFITREILIRMADRQIAWVPTLAPVEFQRKAPHFAGWDRDTTANIARLLDNHAANIALAHSLGVAVIAGSDAGSPGVDHGGGLIDELMYLHGAGLPMPALLRAATSLPRSLWGVDDARIAKGRLADMILLDRSPFDDPQALREVAFVVKGECCRKLGDIGEQRESRPRSWISIDPDDPVALPCISPCAPEG